MDRTLRIIASSLLIACLGIATTLAGKPPKSTTADFLAAPDTPPCSELTEVTGIYQDGDGTYQNVEWFQGDLRFKPLCSVARNILTLLPSEARSLLAPGDWNTCGGVKGDLNSPLLNIPALLNAAACGPAPCSGTAVVGQPSVPGDAGVNTVKHYFLIDSNFDGKFRSGDAPVNILWQSGIHLTRTEYSNRTVYELTTALTSNYAEVHSGGVSLGTFCIPLRLTVTRMK